MPVSKKRAAGREISKDNPGLDDEDVTEQEMGTFKKASEEVLATRRIVKVRRQTSSSAPPASNPFAGIQLVPNKVVSDTPVAVASAVTDAKVKEDVKETEVVEDEGGVVAAEKAEKETEDGVPNNAEEVNGLEKEETVAESDIPSVKETLEAIDSSVGAVENKPDEVSDNKVEESDDATKVGESGNSDTPNEKDLNKVVENSSGSASNLNPFLQLSGSKNAFTGFTGTGFSGSAFSFNPISSDGSPAAAGLVLSTGQKTDQPLFSFGLSPNTGNGSFFGTKDSSITKSETTGNVPSLQEVPTETGEENEKAVFTANSALFEYLDGGWKERGRGEVKVNVSTLDASKARLVMRTKGNLRLILNASLYPEMKLTYMDKKGITFACINSNGEGKGALTTYALKFKDGSIADEFHAIVTEQKGVSTTTAPLKTPENSPQ